MFNKPLSDLSLLQKDQKIKQSPSWFFPSPQVMSIKCLSLTKAVMDTFYPFSHTSGNRRFSNFSFFKPKMNYYLLSKLSLISRTRKIPSYSGLPKNNLFYVCSTSEVWLHSSYAAYISSLCYDYLYTYLSPLFNCNFF